MNLKVIHAPRRRPTPVDARCTAHPEYPIEQAFGSDDPTTQQQLMQLAWRGAPDPEQTLLVADFNGLRVLARCEPALSRTEEALRRRFGAALVAGAPAVRYADCVPLLEPYMGVLVSGPASHLPAVRIDLTARRGSVTRVIERGSFVLEGEAPLANLLGYHRHMRELLCEHWRASHVATWLSRYVAVDRPDPAAA